MILISVVIQNDEIREALRAAGADEEFAELREARLEFVKASRDANTEIAGAILEVTNFDVKATATSFEHIDK